MARAAGRAKWCTPEPFRGGPAPLPVADRENMLGPFTKTNDLEALQMVLSKLSYRVGDLPLLCTGKLILCEGKKKKNLLEVLKLTFFFFNSPSLGRKQYSENFVLQHKSETLSLCYISCLISLVLWNPWTRTVWQGSSFKINPCWRSYFPFGVPCLPTMLCSSLNSTYSFRRVPHSNSSSSSFIFPWQMSSSFLPWRHTRLARE